MIFASFLSKEWNHVLLIYSGFYSPAGISDCLVCAASTKKGFLLIHHFFFPLINLWIFAIGAGKCPCTAAGYCFLNGVCVAAPAGYYSPASVSDCFTWFDSSAIVFLYCCFFINEIVWLMIFLQSGRKSWSTDLLLRCRWLTFFKVTFLLLHFLIVLIPLGYCSTGGNCAVTAPGYYSPSGFTDCIQCVTALKPGISSFFWSTVAVNTNNFWMLMLFKFRKKQLRLHCGWCLRHWRWGLYPCAQWLLLAYKHCRMLGGSFVLIWREIFSTVWNSFYSVLATRIPTSAFVPALRRVIALSEAVVYRLPSDISHQGVKIWPIGYF